MSLDFSSREAHLPEQMDDPSCDRQKLFNTYRQFAVINRLLCRWGAIYRRRLRPRMMEGKIYRLLDVGFGGGDISRALAAWAARDAIQLQIVAIDTDPRALQFVRSKDWNNTIEFREATTSDLVRAGERFDFVISNAVLHHIADEQFDAFVKDVETLTSSVAIMNDIERSAFAYWSFRLLVGPLFRKSFASADGQISIRRSYRAAELRARLSSRWKVLRMFPCRLLALYTP